MQIFQLASHFDSHLSILKIYSIFRKAASFQYLWSWVLENLSMKLTIVNLCIEVIISTIHLNWMPPD